MSYKVLIVDDEPLMCQALTTIVSAYDDFEVIGNVCTGEEAVEICQQKEVNIIFMDIVLPGMTGIEAARMISRTNPDVEIIVVSILSSFDVIKQTLASRIRDYLVKPVSFSDIDRVLLDFLSDQKEDRDISERLLALVYERQYQSMIRTVPDAVHEIFENSRTSKETLLNKFMQIARYIIGEAVPYVGKDLNLAETFPVNEVFAGEEIAWVFWLSSVMDYVFRQTMIHKHDYLKPVFAYIDAEIKTDINLSSICDACNISQSYLSKLFRRYCSMSVMDYIHQQKLMKAKMYIIFTDLSMTQIGHHIGYNDGSYFSKVFKKYEGMSPKQFKMSYSGDGIKKEDQDEKQG